MTIAVNISHGQKADLAPSTVAETRKRVLHRIVEVRECLDQPSPSSYLSGAGCSVIDVTSSRKNQDSRRHPIHPTRIFLQEV
jgi:hypothetical protein